MIVLKKIVSFLLIVAPIGITQDIFILQQGRNGYGGCTDAHILINKPDWNTGGEDGLEATGNGGEADAKHALLRFDLANLPTSVVIDSAWVMLYLMKRRTPQSGPKTLAVYALHQPWGEGRGNDPGGYDGRPALAGEATWQHASVPDRPWAIAGANHVPGDRHSSAEDQRTISAGDPVGTWYSWNLTRLVQYWLAHPDSNLGFVLREPLVSPHTGILNFASSEAEADSLRPKLCIRLAEALPQLIVETMRATAHDDAITLIWPFRGDGNANGYAEVALARAGDSQWGPKITMERQPHAFVHTFRGLGFGVYHVRGWASDPDGVQGTTPQTLVNIELLPSITKSGELLLILLDDNRLRVVLTFQNDGNGNNSAQLAHKASDSDVWKDDGLMARKGNAFEAVIGDLIAGGEYEVMVTLSDPDGVEGTTVFISRITIPTTTAAVRILSRGRKQFQIQSGMYTVSYDSAQTDSYLWISANQPSNTVLRNAVATGLPFSVLHAANLDSISITEDDDGIYALFYGRWQKMSYRVWLDFYKKQPGFFHWRCSLLNRAEEKVGYGLAELTFYDRQRRLETSAQVKSYVQQAPFCVGVAYGYEPQAIQGTIFYLQNLTALNRYFSIQRSSPEQCVRIDQRGGGFLRPSNNRPLPTEETIITDAYLRLTPGQPSSEIAIADRFLTALADVYERLEKPAVEAVDWRSIALNLLRDLEDGRCVAYVRGERMLRSYVAVPRLNTAEAITQLDVLLGIRSFEKVFGNVTDLDDQLTGNLYQFYNLVHRTMVNDAPSEGVQEGDSWYAIHIHLGLSRLAKIGDFTAATLLHLSLPKLIAFAQKVDYQFPVFFRYADDAAIAGREPDVTGGYIYLMLDAYELTGDSFYLEEAKKAAQRLSGYGFQFTYEVHMTATTCAALARLYRLTGDRSFIEKSYLPFANIMTLCWLWECDYGFASEYPTFFGLVPMREAAVITMMEQHHSWYYLREYRLLCGDQLPIAIQTLLDGFLSYTPVVLKYSLPPFLPSAAITSAPTIYGSYNVASFYIPLEDLRDGWQQSGSLGQQIYGAGGPLIFAATLATTVMDERQDNAFAPSHFTLLQNRPNPFNQGTRILFHVPTPASVRLEIFDVLGRRVKLLREGFSQSGEQEIFWDGRNEEGELVASGVLFLQLSVDEKKLLRKMVLMR